MKSLLTDKMLGLSLQKVQEEASKAPQSVNEKFEKYICDNQLIESNIGNELYQSLIKENFKSLAKKQTHHRVKIRLMAMHHIQRLFYCICCGFGINISYSLKNTNNLSKKVTINQ
jgi:hypothetical protein